MHSEKPTLTAKTALWAYEGEEHDFISTRTFGFWLYLLSDALIFAGLFASYAVMDNPMSAFGHPLANGLLSASRGLIQTFIVLGSVFSVSVGSLGLKTGNKGLVLGGLAAGGLLGALFIWFGVSDLQVMAAAGNGPLESGYLACLYALLITHALHMGFGLLWIVAMFVHVARWGLDAMNTARLLCLRMFWQFQASVWVVIYVYVYLFGGAH
ncbi:cytochrome c oxidase subunit 3 [Acidocella sp.]|uniref:cytochrome c oxidase subunit 3 n=1 Tax=Acidocella sp. TaxID=50710 RepID=UPI002621967A|nr:cytochrome c oxidase subunit 3 [Acidocella sp.]